ncbi:MAG: four helix bundle protein [Candidatus Latescibacteria bacterium]|nr:four helix bundle protein [Candidatus Latescibacterota bacterium]
MKENIQSFRDLRIWQDGISLTKEIYRLTAKFPNREIYGLTSQLRRASVSIPSNIAEGHIRKTTTEFKYFLYIALGSLAELETQIIISYQLQMVSENDRQNLINRIEILGKQIRSLITKLKTKPQSPTPKPISKRGV